MFIDFFYNLKEAGIPVTPTAFLCLHKALSKGLVVSMEDFYTVARTVLVKSEKNFDLYDQVFAYQFQGAEFEDPFEEMEIEEALKAMLEEWLRDPGSLAEALGVDPDKLQKLDLDELVKYFLERLKEQKEAHHGGSKWIGTHGTSPVGHSGYHPGGMRVGGKAGRMSAVKLALERRYQDYSQQGHLGPAQIGEALRRLRNMIPDGPKDRISIEKTMYQTMKNGGEIEIVFDRGLKDRVKVILMIDNGGWSMDPYIEVCQTLFTYAHSQFKEINTYFFHNCIYDYVWEDPPRKKKSLRVADFIKKDPETRLIILGDASMAPSELIAPNGIIYYNETQSGPAIESLDFLVKTFPRAVWLNPKLKEEWPFTRTIDLISKIFPMFELTLDGLESAIAFLMKK